MPIGLTAPEGTTHDLVLSSRDRLAAVRATGLLDGASSPVLDRLARLVTRVVGVPVSIVSLVDDRRQHFPGMCGLDGWPANGRGTSLTHSFCQYVVQRDAPVVIPDASLDPFFRFNLAVSELGIMAYLGVPLRRADGQTLGALCAVDSVPHTWTPSQIEALEDLAAAAMAEIELKATIRVLLETQAQLKAQVIRDDMTGLLNRRGFEEQAARHLAAAERTRLPFVVVTLDLDNFKLINDALGHSTGDDALVSMASVLRAACRATDIVARIGGDEFALLLPDGAAEGIDAIRARLMHGIEQENSRAGKLYRLSASIGCATWSAGCGHSLAELKVQADAAMYAAKRARYSPFPASDGGVTQHAA